MPRSPHVLGHLARLAVVAVLALAIWSPFWSTEKPRADWVILVDQSSSVDPDAALELAHQAQALSPPEGVRLHLVLFDDEPTLVHPGTELRLSSDPGSDGEQALELALGLIPAEGAGRIVLASDGHFTSDIEGALAQAQERGVPVDRFPLPSREGDFIHDIELPDELAPKATLEGLLKGPGELTVAGEAAPLSDGHFTAQPDPERIEVTATLGEQVRTEVLLRSGPPRVLVLAAHELSVQPLVEAYREEGFDVDVSTPSRLVKELPAPSLYDLVVVADLPAYAPEGAPVLPPELIHDLRRAVSAGTGLIALGSESSYELGGWDLSELGPVLPVTANPSDGRGTARVAMAVMLDKSGSMGARVGTKTKMQLANEGTVAAMQLLRHDDMLTVASVDTGTKFAFPLMQVAPGSMEAKIHRISHGGGGIYTYTALVDARRALGPSNAPLKHIILFTDAADSEEHFKGTVFGWGPGHAATNLAHQMWTEGISLSVIGIGYGTDQDTPFLRELAKSGGGRFYLTSDATQLKALFVKETRRLVGTAVRERAYKPKPVTEHPSTEGIDFRSGPWLSGYVKVKARPTSEVLLEGAFGDPLLVSWRYGMGNVAALATDAGPRWAQEFSGWEGYATFHTQLARWAMRGDAATDLQVDIAGEQLTVRVRRRDMDGFALDETLKVVDGQTPIEMRLLEPGLWEGHMRVQPGQQVDLSVLADGEEVLAQRRVVEPYKEHRGPSTWTGVTALDQPPEPTKRNEGVPLGPSFAWLALLLLPLDALLRRPLRG